MTKGELMILFKDFVMDNKGNACSNQAFQALSRIATARANIRDDHKLPWIQSVILQLKFDLRFILPKEKASNYQQELEKYEQLIKSCTT